MIKRRVLFALHWTADACVQMSSGGEGELTRSEQRAVAQVVGRFAAQQRVPSIPFSLLVQPLPARRRCSLGPRASDRLRASLWSAVRQPDFDAAQAERVLNELRAELMPRERQLRIRAIRCPEQPVPDPSRPPGSAPAGEECCIVDAPGGCDADAGRTYYAKTDGFRVWFAELLFTAESRRTPVSNPLGSGTRDHSLMTSVLLHEFGHVMHISPSTTGQFAALEAMYWDAARLVPLALRSAGRVRVSHADMLEFVATAFAAENARLDSAGRDECG